MAGGTKVTTARAWRERRRELLDLFTREMYGRAPGKPTQMSFRQVEGPAEALSGAALRKQVKLTLEPGGAAGPSGNWIESGKNPFIDLSCVVDNRATAVCRGINARQWPVIRILEHGYALATFYRGDIDPDRADRFSQSVRALYPDLQQGDDNFSTIGAWAWPLSRALDCLEADRQIDAGRVAVFGWSRLGKAALWAGASDERFAMVISNESGAGGAKLFRRGVGENIRRLNTVFPHWYCRNFRRYNDRDTTLPFDQHMVIAMWAPRPICIGSAENDTLADPEGEFLSAKAAGPVYRLLGKDGLPTGKWPPLNQPVSGQIGYHVRRGGHDVTDFDWAQYLAFADRHLRRPSA